MAWASVRCPMGARQNNVERGSQSFNRRNTLNGVSPSSQVGIRTRGETWMKPSQWLDRAYHKVSLVLADVKTDLMLKGLTERSAL